MSPELEVYLRLYNKGRCGPSSLYIEDMEGAKILAYWLLETIEEPLKLSQLDWWKSGYELQRLAMILNITEKELWNHLESLKISA